MPCTYAGKLISIASDSMAESAFMRTTAVPSATTFTRQSTRVSSFGSIVTSRVSASASGVRHGPSSSSVTRASTASGR